MMTIFAFNPDHLIISIKLCFISYEKLNPPACMIFTHPVTLCVGKLKTEAFVAPIVMYLQYV